MSPVFYMSSPKLELYFFASCPFCVYVINTIQKYKIRVDYKDILSEKENRQQLLRDTGRQTVPCLYIDGNPMHESSDIIRWLETNIEKLEKVEE